MSQPALRFDVRLDHPQGWPLVLRVMRGRRRVGHLIVDEARPGSNSLRDLRAHPRCAPALARVEREAGRPLRAFVVWNSALDAAEQNQGTGVAMYARAVDEVALLGGALLPSLCVHHGPSTSSDARRVWASHRFAERVVVVDGLVAYAALVLPPGPRSTR